jgi:protein-L-isoaspartate(D-aspartate) O-methyltransferase
MKYRTKSAKAGAEEYEKPAFVCHFFDEQRREIGAGFLGPWLGTSDWKTAVKVIPVPIRTREMIVRVGLNGATGELWVDEIEMSIKPR